MDPNLFRYVWSHSRRDQLIVLGMIALSLPFYWLSLDIPRRIVNEALQGKAFEDGSTTASLFGFSLSLPDWLGGTIVISDGVEFDRLGFLLALSFLFLFFVVANGAFKYGINISKGMLAERMMRRMRFELFARLMRFKPERIRAVKPAEAASMIKDEVEPIGGFIGDAFIQPAILGTQALTALLFIMVQSVWLGGVALAIVLVQAFVIPYLRREQLRLARLRQIASRRLAGRIGEMVDGAPTLHAHGLRTYSEAEIGSRLSGLFDIRAALYKRKFAVKYLNNFLAQITPFFFYSIGGYLALQGSLDIGQLVAVIAAYRDLPPPIKELIDWDQRRADAAIKYEQIIAQFPTEATDADEGEEGITLPDDAPIELSGVTVQDQRGTALLSGLTIDIPRGAHVAFAGPAASGRDLAARIVGRQTTEFDGRAVIAGHDIPELPALSYARTFAYVPPDPIAFSGSIRENVVMALRRKTPEPGAKAELRWQEAARTGNPLVDDTADWVDYAAAGIQTTKQIDQRIVSLFRALGLGGDLYSYGLNGRLAPDTTAEDLDRIVVARHEFRKRLSESGAEHLLTSFDPDRFNDHATLGENLRFGVLAGDRTKTGARASDPFVRSILAAEALVLPLAEIGRRVVATSVELFGELPAGHALFDRFSMIKAADLETYSELLEETDRYGVDQLPKAQLFKLVGLAFDYIEPRHRLGLVTDEIKARVLRARQSVVRYLPQAYETDIEFYDPDRVTMAAPLRDNLLFGRVAQNVANADKRISELLTDLLCELDLEDLVYSQGLDFDVGPRGSSLFAQQRAA
ncbi:MAG: ABC transporter ATP-binding protein, partial [Pseudomonadota bacterium]